MRVAISKHYAWFLFPTIQFLPASPVHDYVCFPWMLTIWWGTRGLSLIGHEDG